MFIYSEERLVPPDVNMIVLRATDESGYFYAHRSVYDQAVILNYLYREVPGDLVNAISSDGTGAMREDVQLFRQLAPDPLKILAPYLLLVDEPLETIADCVGALHVISTVFNFVTFPKTDPSVRASVAHFSLTIREEYKTAWESFFMLARPWGSAQPTQPAKPQLTVGVNEDGSMNENAFIANLQALNGSHSSPSSDAAEDDDDFEDFSEGDDDDEEFEDFSDGDDDDEEFEDFSDGDDDAGDDEDGEGTETDKSGLDALDAFA